MVDPTVFVARPVMTSAHDGTNDIVLTLDDLVDEPTFRATFARIAYGVAGVPQRLKAFREGDPTTVKRPGDIARTGSTGLRLDLKRAGTPIPSNDVWIAALCRQYSLPLLSRDRHFDAVTSIRRIHW